MAIAEVIKFEGPQDALVWKFPIEDFNATSQLIVDETHEALLVVNGNAADLFTAGRRTLSVPNIPIARTLIEIPTGGNSPFPCTLRVMLNRQRRFLNGGRAHRSRISNFIRELRSFPACSGICFWTRMQSRMLSCLKTLRSFLPQRLHRPSRF